MTRVRPAAAAVALLALAGCGSTVQVASTRLQPGASASLQPGSSAPAVTQEELTGAVVGGLRGGGAAPGSAEGSPGQATTTGTTGGRPTTTGTAALTGRGFTATTVYVGAGVQDDANQYGSTLGLSVSVGDTRAQIRALVDEVNRTGGVLGRKLEVVFHNTPTAEGNTDPSTAANQACADWTEDHKVVAVLNTVAAINHEGLFACLARHDTPLLFGDNGMHGQAEFSRFGSYLYAPAVLTVERMVPVLVPRLVAQGYFHGWDTLAGAPGSAPVKVGLLYDESLPASKVYADLVKRELTRRGIAVPDVVGISGDLSTMGSQLSSAVLRFRRDGITHVIPGNLFFMQAAEQAKYRPRYAVTSYDAPGLEQTTVPASQLRGALGVGYLPGADVDSSHQGPDVSPAEGRCRRLMQAARQQTSNAITFFSMAIKCDLYFSFDSGAEKSADLSAVGFRSGLEALGTTFSSATTFRSRFGPGRHDGGAGVRDLGYDDSCSCFTYRGPVTPA